MQEIQDFMLGLSKDFSSILNSIKFVFTVYAVGLLIEHFNPAEKNQSSESIRFNILYTIFFIGINFFIYRELIKLNPMILDAINGSFITLSFEKSIPNQILHIVSYLFIFDFFYYWFHRLQHKSKLLWAQHRFHHADRDLNITTAIRHHWLENSIRIFIITIPMSVLFAFDAKVTGLIWSSVMLYATYFVHLNIKLNYGWMSSVITGPQLHRIHHSNQKQHLDKNFAAIFPVYDVIFKTYHKPQKDEYPTTGLYKNNDNMNTLLKSNLYPLQYWLKRFKKILKK